VRTFNGTPIEDLDRKDHEIGYINQALKLCLQSYQADQTEEVRIEQLDDPRL
jgi:hypothetical protein